MTSFLNCFRKAKKNFLKNRLLIRKCVLSKSAKINNNSIKYFTFNIFETSSH